MNDLRKIVEQTRPTTLSVERCLPVLGELQKFFTVEGLQRGSVLELSGGPGATSLAMSLLAGAVRTGSWVAVVGFDTLGWEAAEGIGVPLENVVVVHLRGESTSGVNPSSGRPPYAKLWPKVLTQLVASFDLVLCGPHINPGAAQVRQLRSRARERGSVVMGICRGTSPGSLSRAPSGSSTGARGWVGADVRMSVESSAWEGLGKGWGRLAERRLEVVVEGRGAMNRARKFLVRYRADGGLAGVESVIAEEMRLHSGGELAHGSSSSEVAPVEMAPVGAGPKESTSGERRLRRVS